VACYLYVTEQNLAVKVRKSYMHLSMQLMKLSNTSVNFVKPFILFNECWV
jgi:hypothetical protein